MSINTSNFEKALKSLDDVLKLPKDDIIRDSAIQRFEYSYELGMKLLRRHLENISESSIEIEHMSFKNLLRTGAEKGLIDDPVAWFEFREKRNMTSHTYNQEKADMVYSCLPDFYKRSMFLLEKLKNEN
ncbi:nucleotidyltransferase substrate binding protein [Rickettsiales bacterium]|nr:nucleotidyltransferase substrate binding protein [Rickettsiales bacterium]